MIRIVVIFSLILSAANWLVFLAAAVLENMPAIRLALERRADGPSAEPKQMAERTLQGDKLIDATGGLATSLRRAGPGASAAAMSLACLLVALAAGAFDDL